LANNPDNTMAYGYSTLNVGNLYSLGDEYYQAKARVWQPICLIEARTDYSQKVSSQK